MRRALAWGIEMATRRAPIALLAVALALAAFGAERASARSAPPPGRGAGVAAAPLCRLPGVVCAHAWSVTHRMVAGAKRAFRLYRSSDAATHDVGFLRNALVDVMDADGFCSASQDCYFATLYDQTGHGCDLSQAVPAKMPQYWTWAAHDGLPVVETSFVGESAGSLALVKAGCGSLAGNAAKTLIQTGSNRFASFCCGMFGLMEDRTAAGNIPRGSMFAAMWYKGSQFSVDLEGDGRGGAIPAAVEDGVGVISYDGAGFIAVDYNGANVFAGPVPAGYNPLAVQSKMVLGHDGDGIYYGPAIFFDGALVEGALGSAARAAVHADLSALYARLSAYHARLAAPSGPADLFVASGVNAAQIQYMVAGWGLRRLSAEYYGPLIKACRGASSTCKDIGSVEGDLDVASAARFCGEECSVELAYNQALDPGGNGHRGAVLNMTAPAPANRPALIFECIGARPCLRHAGGQYLCYSGQPNNSGSWTLSVVARRGADHSGQAAAFAGYAALDLVGFADARDTLYAQAVSVADGGAGLTLAGIDDAWHSESLVAGGNGDKLAFYGDGERKVGSSKSTFVRNGCLGADPQFTHPLTGDTLEAYLFSGPNGFAASPGQIASLRANQRAYWGF